MASQWFYTRAGKQFGPVSGAVLRQLVDAGDLLATDLIQKEGSDRWRAAGEVKGLFPTSTANTAGGRDRAEPGGELEISAFARFLCKGPMGFLAWAVFVALCLVGLDVAILARDANGFEHTNALLAVIDAIYAMLSLSAWFWLRAAYGKRTACPRCKAWFARLLLRSDARVVHSREDTLSYTGQAVIRDRNFQVAGYVDEQRAMPVTVKTIVADRKYRCKACGHRWESTEVGNVIV